MHEHPYLNGANDEKLKVGEVVSNEPVSSAALSPGLVTGLVANVSRGSM